MPSGALSRVAPLGALLLLFAFTAFDLDSDPSPLKRITDFSDEGFWQHNARCHALFGTWLPDEFNQAIIGAPLFTGLLRLSFTQGVSIFAARIVPIVALWLILLMVFDVLRREISPMHALAIVIALGVMHEILMYARLSTPLLPETACHVAVLWFTDRAARRGGPWMIAAGLAAAAAFAMKLSAFSSAIGVAAFVVASFALRREIGKVKLLGFAAGWLTGMAALGIFFLWNAQQFKFFWGTIGAANLHRPWNPALIPLDIARFFDNLIFSYPSAAAAVLLASLWFCGQCRVARQCGLAAALIRMTRSEFFCLCWLGGAAVVLGISPDKADRRYVGLLVPLVILAGMFACRTLRAPRTLADNATDVNKDEPSRAMSWLFFLVCGLYWTVLMRNAIGAVQRYAFEYKPSGHRLAIWSFCVVAGLLLSALCHLARKQKVVVAGAAVFFFAAALLLDGLWYKNATWTVRDASRRLGQILSEKEYLIGDRAHELALENRSLPIWSPLEPVSMNHWFDSAAAHLEFVECVEPPYPDETLRTLQPTPLGAVLNLAPARQYQLMQFELCPSAITGQNRLQVTLYHWAPGVPDHRIKAVPAASSD
jgi:hypothetical protein